MFVCMYMSFPRMTHGYIALIDPGILIPRVKQILIEVIGIHRLYVKNHRVLCWCRLHMSTTFGDDWSKIASCIAENVTISFKHEYRRNTLT